MEFSKKYLILIALGLLIPLTSCGKKEGFSLANSQGGKDMGACMALLKKKKHEKAIKCFESYKSRNYGGPKAAEADLAVADAYFAKKEYLVAAEAYQQFIEGHAFHPKAPYAYYKAGLSYLKETPKSIDRDQAYLPSAVKYLEAVVRYYSNSPFAGVAQEAYNEARLKLAKRHYYIGRYYYKSREYLAAIPRFQAIVTDYPKLGLDEKSFYYLIRALSKVNQKDLANQYFEVFKTHYPESEQIKRIASFM